MFDIKKKDFGYFPKNDEKYEKSELILKSKLCESKIKKKGYKFAMMKVPLE
jgi:hypothetical protein